MPTKAPRLDAYKEFLAIAEELDAIEKAERRKAAMDRALKSDSLPSFVDKEEFELFDSDPAVQAEYLANRLDDIPQPEKAQGLPPRETWEEMGRIGFKEHLGQVDYAEKIPFLGGFIKGGKLHEVRVAVEGLQKFQADPDYWLTDADRKRHHDTIEKFLVEAQYYDERGISVGAQIGEGVVDLIPFALEIYATGPAAGFSRAGVGSVGKAFIRKYGKGYIKKKVIRGAAWTAAGATRATLMPGRVIEGYEGRRMPTMELTDQGKVVVTAPGQGKWTAAWKAYGDVVIEAMSEEAGAEIGKRGRQILSKVPGAKKISKKLGNTLQKEWSAATGETRAQFIKRLFKRGGFHGILEEFGEERLGAFMRAVTGIEEVGTSEDNNTFLKRLALTIPSGEQTLVELGIFAIPGGGRAALTGIAGRMDDTQSKKALLTKEGAIIWAALNPEKAGAIAAIEQPSRRDFADNEVPAFKRFNATEREQVANLLRESASEFETITARALEQSATPEPGQEFTGRVYRGQTATTHPEGRTAVDVLDYEAERDTEINLPDEIHDSLAEVPAEDLVWVTMSPEDAEQYGEVQSLDLTDATTIATDDKGGVLLLLSEKDAAARRGEVVEEPSGAAEQAIEEAEAEGEAPAEAPAEEPDTTPVTQADRFTKGTAVEWFDEDGNQFTGKVAKYLGDGNFEIIDRGGKKHTVSGVDLAAKKAAIENVPEGEEEGFAEYVVEWNKSINKMMRAEQEMEADKEHFGEDSDEYRAAKKLYDDLRRETHDTGMAQVAWKREKDKRKGEEALQKQRDADAEAKEPADPPQEPAGEPPAPEGPEIPAQEPTQQEEAVATEEQAPRDYGTVSEPNRATLSEHFADRLRAGHSYKTIVEARKEAGELLGGQVKPGTLAVKTVDEAVEVGVVRAAREIIDQGRKDKKSDREIFDLLVDLYNRQPNLGSRTSTSILQQAYSTPVPLAFLVSRLAGINNRTTVYEPTAGNGILLVEANPDRTYANELNAARAEALESLGFEATQSDATEYVPDEQVDVVVMNPPFGHVKDPSGKNKTWAINSSFSTPEVDHAIVFKALEAMADDGRAVLIIGGKQGSQEDRAKKYAGKNVARFAFFLHREYNVVAHFSINGDLYSRQGASYPVDVIVIEGRGESQLNLPAVDVPEVINTFDELKEKLDAGPTSGVADKGPTPPSVGTGGKPGVEPGGGGAAATEGETTGEGPAQRPAGAAGPVDVSTGGPAEGAAAEPTVAGGRRPGVGPTGAVGGQLPTGERPGAGEPGSADTTRGRAGGREVSGGPERPGKSGSTAGQPSTTGGREPGGVAPDVPAVGRGDTRPAVKPKKPSILDNLSADDQKTAEDLKQHFKDKYGKGGPTVAAGLPGEDIIQAARLAALYVKAGAKAFVEFVKNFANDLPDISRNMSADDFKAVYSAARYQVEAEEREGMTPDIDVAAMPETTVKAFVGEAVAVEEPAEEPTEEPAEEAEEGGDEVVATTKEDGTEYQEPYVPRSKMTDNNVLVPRNMKQALERALIEIEKEHGDLDKWVMKELGWTEDELRERLYGPQVDAFAMALHQIKNGTGFVLGDQTGIGKGRVLAAMVQWAKKNGRVPVFITDKPNLYTDMIRDLTNTGWPKFNPFITNNGLRGEKALETEDGGLVESVASTNEGVDAEMQQVMDDGDLGDYDAIMTTYSQLQTINRGQTAQRHAFLHRMIPGSILILDESHLAGGQEGARVAPGARPRSQFARELLMTAEGLIYSSATWAKHPGVMDLYRRTNMINAVGGDPTLLASSIRAGGVPLQQVVSAMLTEVGQYARRETSFTGIEINKAVVPASKDSANSVASGMQSIHDFDLATDNAIHAVEDDVTTTAGTVTADGSHGMAGVNHTGFSSLMHNIINQSLLAAKADAAADAAIASLEAGIKPVIALANTMESMIKNYAELKGVTAGQPFLGDFCDLLLRYLERSREVIVTDAFGNKSRRRFTDEELGPVALALYNRAKKKIEDSDLSKLPLSPIDHITQRLKDAGYAVGELTGRKFGLDYSRSDAPSLYARSSKDKSANNKIRTIRSFNGGMVDKPLPDEERLDVIIMNQSGATGVSMHSYDRFADQRPRKMFVLQAEANIDTFMQILGRINRTGQVVLPSYVLMMSDIPAEKRPAAVLAKKLASLNANVTSDRTGDIGFDVPDIMNQYGDEVVRDLMESETDLHLRLGAPLDPEGGGLSAKNAAAAITGRIAMLQVDEQEHYYNMIEMEYNERLALLDATGQNALVAKVLPLSARLRSTTTVTEGRPESPDPFSRGAQLEYMSVKRIGKPERYQTIRQRIVDLLSDLLADTDKPSPQRQRLLAQRRTGATSAARPWNVRGKAKAISSSDITDEQLEKAGKARTKEELDSGVSAYNRWVEEELAKITDPSSREVASIRHRRVAETTIEFLQQHHIGKQVTLNVDVSTEGSNDRDFYFGIITNIEHKGASKNPLAPNSWRVTVAVDDAARTLTFPISKTVFRDRGSQQGGSLAPIEVSNASARNLTLFRNVESLEEAFEKASANRREYRFIATGNLLSAFSNAMLRRGQIVQFTMENGDLRQGILMPKNFDFKAFEEGQPVQFSTPEKVLQFLDRVSQQAGMQVVSADEALRVVSLADQHEFNILVDKTRARGGKFFLNQELIDAVGQDFVLVGPVMRVHNVPHSRILNVLKAIYKIENTLLETQAAKDIAGEITGTGQTTQAAEPEKGDDFRTETSDTPTEQFNRDIAEIDTDDPLAGPTVLYSGLHPQMFADIFRKLRKRFEKGSELNTDFPEAYEALRSVFASKEMYQDQALKMVMAQFGDLTLEDRQLLMWNRENPNEYPLPAHLEQAAALRDAMFDHIERNLLTRKMIGKWPESMIARNIVKIEALEGQLDEVRMERTKRKINERILQLEQANEMLAELRYARRIVERPEVAIQLEKMFSEESLSDTLKSRPKRLLGRKMETMQDVIDAGFKLETDIAVALADLMAYAKQKIAVFDVHEEFKKNKDLVRKEQYSREELWKLGEEHGLDKIRNKKTRAAIIEQLELHAAGAWAAYQEKVPLAPAAWVKLRGYPQYKGWKVHPFFREAIYDFTETLARTTWLGRWYDATNSVLKQAKFYNFMVMSINNLQQGFVAAGIRSPLNIPGAFLNVAAQDELYRKCQARDLFSIPEDLPTAAFLDVVREKMAALDDKAPLPLRWLRAVTGYKTMDEFLQSLNPFSREKFKKFIAWRPLVQFIRFNRKLTWWLDRVFRVATVKALMQKGMTVDAAIIRARTYHADYNIAKKMPARWMRRMMLTPAYQTAMWYRLFPEMIAHPKKNAGPLARLAGLFLFTNGMMAMMGFAWSGWYRWVRKEDDEEGTETNILFMGPFSEPFKMLGRVEIGLKSGKIFGFLTRPAYNKLSALPHLAVSLNNNKDWRGERIWTPGAPKSYNARRIAQFLLHELYPMTQQIGDWGDPETQLFDNVLRIATITRFSQKPKQEWYENKVKAKLGQIRGWAKDQAALYPDLTEHYYRIAGKNYADYVENLNDFIDKHNRRLAAMKSTSAMDRLLIQFGLNEAPPLPDHPTIREKDLGRRLWELGEVPQKQKGETAERYAERMADYGNIKIFTNTLLEADDLTFEDAKATLQKEARRRGLKTAVYQRSKTGRFHKDKYGRYLRTGYGKRLKVLRDYFESRPVRPETVRNVMRK